MITYSQFNLPQGFVGRYVQINILTLSPRRVLKDLTSSVYGTALLFAHTLLNFYWSPVEESTLTCSHTFYIPCINTSLSGV